LLACARASLGVRGLGRRALTTYAVRGILALFFNVPTQSWNCLRGSMIPDVGWSVLPALAGGVLIRLAPPASQGRRVGLA
jgi:hypothetical protein